MPKISGTICYNCFRELPSNSGEPSLEENSAGGPCPYCGFDLEEKLPAMRAEVAKRHTQKSEE